MWDRLQVRIMAEPGRKNRRRNVYSNPKAQSKIILLFFLLAVLYAGVNWYISLHTIRELASSMDALPLSEVARHDLDVLVSERTYVLNLQLTLFTVLSTLTVALGGLLLSHRIGGPIYHLRTYMKGLAAGHVAPGPVCFRRNDFFHDLAAAFNALQRKQGLLPAGEAGDDGPETAGERQ